MVNSDGKHGFKNHVKEIVAEPALSNEDLDALIALQENTLIRSEQSVDCRPTLPERRYFILGLAASLFFLIVVSFHFFQGTDRTSEIALEAVHNHLNAKPLEVVTSSMTTASNYFTRLDFAPVDSAKVKTLLSNPSDSLNGGRYCTIKGVKAAQFRYGETKKTTLFQADYNQALHGDVPSTDKGGTPVTHFVKGLEVNIWQEKGLLMVAVRSPD